MQFAAYNVLTWTRRREGKGNLVTRKKLRIFYYVTKCSQFTQLTYRESSSM